MNVLNISLDENIASPKSRSARRAVEYGKIDKIWYLIPGKNDEKIALSENVVARTLGGGKMIQLWKMFVIGLAAIKKEKIDLITAQDPFFLGLLGWKLKIFTGKKLEIQLHGDFYGSEYYKNFGLAWKARLLLGKFVLCRADKIRVAGERVRKSLLTRGLAEEKIEIRPVAADMVTGNPADLRGRFPKAGKIFVYLGRFDKVKNLPWLVGVFGEVVKNKPDYILLLVGDGPTKKSIEKEVERAGLGKNILLEGWTENPGGYLKEADAFLFPSLSEGYGLAAMEAAAAGTPVIMNDVGVANYELKPGPKIKILPINDKQKWIEAILSI